MSVYDKAIIFYLGSAEVARRNGLAELASACEAKAAHVERIKGAIA